MVGLGKPSGKFMVYTDWLEDNGLLGTQWFDGETMVHSMLNGMLFDSREKAWEGCPLLEEEEVGHLSVDEVGDGTVMSIRKHQLKVRAKELFGLRVNSPVYVVADRYEEEGMIEEAITLRTQVKNRYYKRERDQWHGD